MLRAAMTALRCEAHQALAGWECTACHRALCPDCAATKYVPPVSLTVCALCGELAEPLLRLRRDTQSFAQRVPGAFFFPLRGEGPAVWLGLSMVLWLFGFFGALGMVLAWTAILGSVFGLVTSTARGHDRLELSDFTEPLESILLPVGRFGVAMLPAWGGAVLVGWLGKPWMWWLVWLVTLAWTPTSFIGAASGASVLHLLNPLRVLGVSARIGRDFGVYVAALSLATLAWLFAVVTGLVIRDALPPFIGSALGALVAVYPAVVIGRIAGLVMLVHGTAFGMDTLDEHETVLGDAQPRGEVPQKRSLAAHLPTAIELPEPAAPVLPTPASRFDALEFRGEAPPPPAALDAALLPSHGEQTAAQLRTAMQRGDTDAALDIFRAAGLSCVELLTSTELLWLGQTAGARIDYESSLLALEAAAKKEAPAEERGRAWVMLGRLLAEKLSRRDEGEAWMQRVRAELPNTAAAKFAATWK